MFCISYNDLYICTNTVAKSHFSQLIRKLMCLFFFFWCWLANFGRFTILTLLMGMLYKAIFSQAHIWKDKEFITSTTEKTIISILITTYSTTCSSQEWKKINLQRNPLQCISFTSIFEYHHGNNWKRDNQKHLAMDLHVWIIHS